MPGRRFRGGAPARCFLAAGALALGVPVPAAWGGQSAAATVLRVHDGNSMLVEMADQVQNHVYLLGIEAPSLRDLRPEAPGGRKAVGQPFSGEAKRALEDLVLKKQVRVEFHGRNVAKRPLAVVEVGGENVNVHMVRGGLARVDRAARDVPEAFRAALEQAEAEARRDRRGLWMFE